MTAPTHCSAEELRALREKWVARATGRDVAAALVIDDLIRECFALREHLHAIAKIARRHVQIAPPAGE